MNFRPVARQSKHARRANHTSQAFGELLRREVTAGRQGYIVYPVIEESKLELKAAIEELSASRSKRFRNSHLVCCTEDVEREKETVMQSFRKNENANSCRNDGD